MTNMKPYHRGWMLTLMFAAGVLVGGVGTTWVGTTEVVADATEAKPEMDKVLATIGDTKVYVRDLEKKVLEIPGIMRRNFETVEGKKQLLENLIKGEILYVAAKDAGYDDHDEVQEKVEETVKSIYQSEYFKREIQNAVVKNEQQALEYYNKNREQYAIPESRKVRHLLFDTRDAAIEVKKELDGGATWDEVADEHIDDPAAKISKGLLGYLKNDGNVPNFGNEPNITNAAFNAKEGDVVGPVKSSQGWHLINVEEVIPKRYQDFDKVKAEIADKFLVTDDMVEAEYERTKDEYMTRERIMVHHIQLPSRAKAEEVLNKLKAGEEWDKLARLYSQDAGTAISGGELGYIYRDSVIKNIGKDPQFEAAIFDMKNSTDPGIVQSAKGFHVVKTMNYQPVRQKTLAEVRPAIRNKLLRNAREDLLENEFDKLKAKYNVNVNEDLIIDTTWRLKDVPQPQPMQGGGSGVNMPNFPGR